MKYTTRTVISMLFLLLMVFPDVNAESNKVTDTTYASTVIEAVKNVDLVGLNVLLAEDASVDTVDSEGNTPLMIAAHIGNPRMMKIILSHNPNIDLRNHNGDTALMIASRQGVPQIVEQLIQSGANTNLKNSDGFFPAEIALRNGHNNIVKLFREEVVFPMSR